MLTSTQYIKVDAFAKELVPLVKDAINNKPLMRKRKDGSTFSAPSKASGKTANSVTYEITDTSILIKANDTVFTLIYGRKPTINSGSGELKEEIKRWIVQKGLPVDNIETASFLIARKLHEFGSSIYMYGNGANSGLLDNIVNQKSVQRLSGELVQDTVNEIKSYANAL